MARAMRSFPVPVSPRRSTVYIRAGDRFHLFQNSFQANALTDNVFKPVLCVQLLFEIALFAFFTRQLFLGFFLLRKVADHAQRLICRHRFLQD